MAQEWSLQDMPDLGGRRALVTGAAGGLGYETAAALAARGAQVILADRNVAGGMAALENIRRQTPAAKVEFKLLDLADLQLIRQFAGEVSEGGPLDLLINVAGILPPLQRAATRDGFELKFGINHLGHFALTAALLDALLRSPQPRVVSVSSIVARQARIDFDDLQAQRHYEPQRAYNQAKLACLMFALQLQQLSASAGSSLISVCAHPGVARTTIGNSRKLQKHRRLRDWLEDWSLAMAMRFAGQSPAQGALPILRAATDPTVRGGDYFGPAGFGEFAGPPRPAKICKTARDAAARQKLWEISVQLTAADYGRLSPPPL